MKRYRVVAEWKAAYEDPITLNRNEELWLNGKTEEWDGYRWVWARNHAGKEGWIPDTLVTSSASRHFASAPFSAQELSCLPGQVLVAVAETHGWVSCRAEDGSEGWVPARSLEPI